MARTFAALLVDSNLKGLESLVYGFQGADWRITACPGPETAALLVKASAADVVVVASREPHERTLALVRQLRSQDETRTLPLLVLGPASLRAGVAESGTVEFLPTPVFVRDVISASRIAIAAAHDAEPKIEGGLNELSLLSLLRTMSSLGRSGVLQIERAARRGEVLFSEGELSGAQLGALQGAAALHHLLMWEEGKIDLCLRSVGRRTPVTQRFDQVIEEAERFLRDYSHAMASLGASSTIYDKNEAKLTGSARSFPSEVMPIVRLCDGQRTLADLIDQSPFRVFDTIRIISRLIELGAITRRPSAALAAQSDQDLQKFWETARIASADDVLVPPQPTARASSQDARVGEPSRRKLQRRARAETPVLGTPISELVEAKAPAAKPVVATLPAAGEANRGKERTSGVLQVPSGERRQSKLDRRERPSVTIDVDLVEAAMHAPTPPPVAEPAPVPKPAKPALTPAAGKPVVTASKPSEVTAPARTMGPSPVPAEAAAALPPRSARITGTLQVAPSANRRTGQVPVIVASVAVDPALTGDVSAEMAAAPPTPAPTLVPEKGNLAGSAKTAAAAPSGPPTAHADASRGARVTGTLSVSPAHRTNALKSPSKESSVQLDPFLVAELNRLEKATAPAESATSDVPTVPIKSGGSRITGTLSSASGTHSVKKPQVTPGAGIAVALDPALAEEAQKPAGSEAQKLVVPERVAATASKDTATADAVSAQAPAPTTPSEVEGSRAGARISGAFNAVESDFFAREADLYKGGGDDNFSDLDEPASRSRAGTKTGPRRQNRR